MSKIPDAKNHRKFRFSGKKLKSARTKWGLTQKQIMARLVEMGYTKASTQLIDDWETERIKCPSLEYVMALADIFKVNIDFFLKD